MERPRPWRDRRGQGKTEYGLILVLVGVACVTAIYQMGRSTRDLTQRNSDALAKENAQSEGGEEGGGDI